MLSPIKIINIALIELVRFCQIVMFYTPRAFVCVYHIILTPPLATPLAWDQALQWGYKAEKLNVAKKIGEQPPLGSLRSPMFFLLFDV